MGSKKKGLRFLLISIYVITLIINLLGAEVNSYAESINDVDIRDKTSSQTSSDKETQEEVFKEYIPNLYEKYHWEYEESGTKKYAYIDNLNGLGTGVHLTPKVNVYFTYYTDNIENYAKQTYYKLHITSGTMFGDIINQYRDIKPISDYYNNGSYSDLIVKIKLPNKELKNDYGKMDYYDKVTEDVIFAVKLGISPGQGDSYQPEHCYFYSGEKQKKKVDISIDKSLPPEAFAESCYFYNVVQFDNELNNMTSNEEGASDKSYLYQILTRKPSTLYRGCHWLSDYNKNNKDVFYAGFSYRSGYAYTEAVRAYTDYYAAVNVYFKRQGEEKYFYIHHIREKEFLKTIDEIRKDNRYNGREFFDFLTTESGGLWYIVQDSKGVVENPVSITENTEAEEDVILEYRLPTPPPPTTGDMPRVETPTKPAVETPTKPVVVIPTKPAVETPTKPAVVIPTKPAVETPTKPAIVIPTKPSVETPTEPAVKTPTEPAVAPEPEPTLPVYPLDRLPDPNSPDSPDELVAIDEDGSPLGKYVKRKKPDGKNEYVIEEDLTPKGDTKKPTLPQTGGVPDWLYIALGNAILVYGLLKMKENIKE